MIAVFLAQWQKEKRSPYAILLFIALGIMLTIVFGMGAAKKMSYAVYAGDGLEAPQAAEWVRLLNREGKFEFRLIEEERALRDVREGRAELAVKLMAEDYRIVMAADNPANREVEELVRTVYNEELQLRAAAASADDPQQYREDVERRLRQPPLALEIEAADGGEPVRNDMSLQLLFAFTLYTVIMTVGYKVNAVMEERSSGVWDRMILSPLRKTEIYLGHMGYSFCIGMAHIAVALALFRFVFGFPIGDRYGMLLVVAAIYTIALVAVGMLLTGLTRTPEQFGIVLQIAAAAMPLLGGAYWPPGTVTNPIILAVSEFVPLTHAMEAMKGIALQQYGPAELAVPLAKLLLIAVLCMGVGINMVERRSH